MAPPPVTPSPHRFVLKKPSRPPPSQQPTPLSSNQHFNTTPKFSFPGAQSGSAISRAPPLSTPALTRYNTSARRPSRQRDVIEDDEEEDEQFEVHESFEAAEDLGSDQDQGGSDDDFEIDLRQSKRRRLSNSQDEEMIDHDTNSPNELIRPKSRSGSLSFPEPSPTSPRHVRTHSRPSARFHIPMTPGPDAVLTSPKRTTTAAFHKPPRFQPPDNALSENTAEPLPETFSPHRRGQKFVPGGLAAEVVGWLVNIESSVPSAATGAGRERGKEVGAENWAIKLVADEVQGGFGAGVAGAGMTLVRGRQIRGSGAAGVRGENRDMVDDLGGIKIILAGEGIGVGIQKAGIVDVGKVVGIRGPVWEVVIDNERWGVGVDWRVLN